MRRTEIIQGTKEVFEALIKSEIGATFGAIVSSGGRVSDPEMSTRLLSALRRYSILSHGFSNAGKTVQQILDLDPLDDPSFWSDLINFSADPGPLYSTHSKVYFASNHLPKILKLLERDLVDGASSAAPSEHTESILSVIVIEKPGQFSRPARLIEVLVSIEAFYEVCALMLGMPPQELSVVACDSGSDKAFDFLGAAKVIECVKDLILSVWDRVVFFREHQIAERVRLISDALPVIQQISELEEKHRIAPEQAAILRNKIADGVGKFLHSGAIIPEIQERTSYEPRELMAPERRLITARSSAFKPSNHDEGAPSPEHDKTKRSPRKSRPRKKRNDKSQEDVTTRLSRTERGQLNRLLKKMQAGEEEQRNPPEEP